MSIPTTNLAYNFQLEVKNRLETSNFLKPVTFICENSKDLQFEIKNALGKTGLVAVIMTPTLNYIGLLTNSNYKYPALSYDVELDIQILENVPVNRAKNKSLVITALDIGVYVQQYLGGYRTKLCTRFNPVNVEQTASDQLVVVDSTFNCSVCDMNASQLINETLTDSELDTFYKTYKLLDTESGHLYTPVVKEQSEYSNTWTMLNSSGVNLTYNSKSGIYEFNTIEDTFWTAVKYTGPRWQISGMSNGNLFNMYSPPIIIDPESTYYSNCSLIYGYDRLNDRNRYYVYNGERPDYRTLYMWVNAFTKEKIWMFPKNIDEVTNTYMLTYESNNQYRDSVDVERSNDRFGFTLNNRNFEFILK